MRPHLFERGLAILVYGLLALLAGIGILSAWGLVRMALEGVFRP